MDTSMLDGEIKELKERVNALEKKREFNTLPIYSVKRDNEGRIVEIRCPEGKYEVKRDTEGMVRRFVEIKSKCGATSKDINMDVVRVLRAKGRSLKQIGKKFGVSGVTIHNRLKEETREHDERIKRMMRLKEMEMLAFRRPHRPQPFCDKSGIITARRTFRLIPSTPIPDYPQELRDEFQNCHFHPKKEVYNEVMAQDVLNRTPATIEKIIEKYHKCGTGASLDINVRYYRKLFLATDIRVVKYNLDASQSTLPERK